jgi:hypothetical protein
MENQATIERIDAWKCLKCKRTYTEKEVAEKCCGIRTCECGRVIERRHYTLCDKCSDAAQFRRYMEFDALPWDGVQMLALYRDDRYFRDVDEVCEHIAECDDLDDDTPITQEMIEAHKVVLCDPTSPRTFYLSEHFAESIPEDCEPPDGWKHIERIVNDWAARSNWHCWEPAKKRLLLSTAKAELNTDD